VWLDPHRGSGSPPRDPGLRRSPERTPLYAVVCGELETYLARAQERERVVPRFVERELRAYLRCGLLSHGFVRVRCGACGHDRLVAFSCKGRGFCPSCVGRRMSDTAAHLVDRVLPEAPVRQWVLSLPHALRYRLAYDAALSSAVLGLFIRTVFAALRRRARERFGASARDARCGAVSFVQRFGDALNLNVHFHSLVLDGVYLAGPDGPRFRPLPPPSDAEVERIVATFAHRLVRLLERCGLPEADPTEADPLASDESVLGELYAASVRNRVATGPRAGQRIARLGDRIDADAVESFEGERCARVAGVSLHANVSVPARDRKRLERLCRYVARPPLATERLSRLADGRLLYRLKRRWRDGTTHVVFEPLELLERLVALIPPPRANQIRYHGVLAPASCWRAAVTRDRRPAPEAPDAGEVAAPPLGPALAHTPAASTAADPTDPAPIRAPALAMLDPAPSRPTRSPPRPSFPLRERRLSWAALMTRVFACDVLQCPACGGRMHVIAAIEQPKVIEAILRSLGLATRSPPTAPPRPSELSLSADGAFPEGDSYPDGLQSVSTD
jgi:hypothetical protein